MLKVGKMPPTFSANAFLLTDGSKKLFIKLLPWVIIFAAMVLAFGGRGFWQREFWYDEAFTGLIIAWPWRELFTGLTLDVHPPLYYFVLKGWGGVFGFSDLALRSFSVICFGGFLAFLYAFVRLGTKRKSLAIALLVFFAVNPFFVQYAQEARMYAFLALLVMAAAFFFLRALSASPSAWNADWFFFSFFLALAPLVHYTALLLPPSFLVAGGLFLRRQAAVPRYLIVFAGALLLPLLFFGPWYPYFREQLLNTVEAGWIGSFRTEELPGYLTAFFFGTEQSAYGHPPPRWLFGLVSPKLTGMVLGLAVFLLSQLSMLRRDDTHRFLRLCAQTGAFLVLTFLLLELDGKHLVLSRYLIIAVPFLLIAFALLVARLPQPFPVVLLSVYVCISFSLTPDFPRQDYRLLSQTLSEHSDRPIFFTNPFDYFIASFYNHAEREYLFYQEEGKDDVSGWVLFRRLPIFPSNSALPPGSVFVVRQTAPHDLFASMLVGKAGEFRIYQLP